MEFLKILQKIPFLYIFFLIICSFAPEPLAKEKEPVLDHIIIFYHTPHAYTEPPITKADIGTNSEHNLFIKNKYQIKTIKKLVKEIIGSKEKSKGVDKDVCWLIGLVGLDKTWNMLYVDKKGNFEYSHYHTGKTLSGKMKPELFERLLSQTESLINIIDHEFQKNYFICGKEIC